MNGNTQNQTQTQPLKTRKQAATYLAISERKIDQLAADGSLVRIKIGAAVRFEQADLDAFIACLKSA